MLVKWPSVPRPQRGTSCPQGQEGELCRQKCASRCGSLGGRRRALSFGSRRPRLRPGKSERTLQWPRRSEAPGRPLLSLGPSPLAMLVAPLPLSPWGPRRLQEPSEMSVCLEPHSGAFIFHIKLGFFFFSLTGCAIETGPRTPLSLPSGPPITLPQGPRWCPRSHLLSRHCPEHPGQICRPVGGRPGGADWDLPPRPVAGLPRGHLSGLELSHGSVQLCESRMQPRLAGPGGCLKFSFGRALYLHLDRLRPGHQPRGAARCPARAESRCWCQASLAGCRDSGPSQPRRVALTLCAPVGLSKPAFEHGAQAGRPPCVHPAAAA